MRIEPIKNSYKKYSRIVVHGDALGIPAEQADRMFQCDVLWLKIKDSTWSCLTIVLKSDSKTRTLNPEMGQMLAASSGDLYQLPSYSPVLSTF